MDPGFRRGDDGKNNLTSSKEMRLPIPMYLITHAPTPPVFNPRPLCPAMVLARIC